jgi:hypothetical protein
MNVIDLILQGSDTDDRLTAVLVSPVGAEVIQVGVPKDLGSLHQAWLRRFLAYHDPASAPVPEDVVKEYGARLCKAMRSWIAHSEWGPLRQLLTQLPAIPLRVRCIGTPDLIERLPWEELALDRPIWRFEATQPNVAAHAPRRRDRCPRVLLLVGQEAELDLAGDLDLLERLAGQGRIELLMMRGDQSNLCSLRAALDHRQGWDVLVFLGHSARDPQGGGRLQFADGSWLGGHGFAQELHRVGEHSPALVLLNSCSGIDLARSCTAAGTPWVLCFREAVPNSAASLTFARLLEAMEGGMSFSSALQKVRTAPEESGPAGCRLLLSGMCSAQSVELRLPLSRRRQFMLRLAGTQPRQVLAAAVFVAIGLVGGLVPTNLVSTYLLDRRLEVQRLWRERFDQSGPRRPALPVLLLNERRGYPSLGVPVTPGRVSRAALAQVLRRTPPHAVPMVGLDVVLDETAPHTDELASLIRQQRRRVVAGWFGPEAGSVMGVGANSQPLPVLQKAGLEFRDLGVGTPSGNSGELKPLPLRLLWEVNENNFAAALSELPHSRIPADAILDWSLDWKHMIQVLSVADLPRLNTRALLVGTDGLIDDDQKDLFHAPMAFQGLPAQWGGSSDAIPGALVQVVLAQSLSMGHWLTPLPLPVVTALATGLGVVLSAAVSRARQRLLWMLAISLVSIPASLQLATAQLLLAPIALPITAMTTTCLMRRD